MSNPPDDTDRLRAINPDIAWMMTLAVQFIDDWQDTNDRDNGDTTDEINAAREAHTRAYDYLNAPRPDLRALVEDFIAAYCPADGSPLRFEVLNEVYQRALHALALPAPDAHLSKDKPIKFRCEACGSTDVRKDAYAEWDEDAQDWVLANTFDQNYCEKCEGECTLEEVAIRRRKRPKNQRN